MSLPTDAKERKDMPIARGVLDYFPDAVAAVAHVSKVGNDQHNPGQPMHWARGKSGDHADCIVRHLIERGKIDTDGLRHTAKAAWRALALLQTEIEEAAAKPRDLQAEEQRLWAQYKPGEMVEVRDLTTLTPPIVIRPTTASHRDLPPGIEDPRDSIFNR